MSKVLCSISSLLIASSMFSQADTLDAALLDFYGTELLLFPDNNHEGRCKLKNNFNYGFGTGIRLTPKVYLKFAVQYVSNDWYTEDLIVYRDSLNNSHAYIPCNSTTCPIADTAYAEILDSYIQHRFGFGCQLFQNKKWKLELEPGLSLFQLNSISMETLYDSQTNQPVWYNLKQVYDSGAYRFQIPQLDDTIYRNRVSLLWRIQIEAEYSLLKHLKLWLCAGAMENYNKWLVDYSRPFTILFSGGLRIR